MNGARRLLDGLLVGLGQMTGGKGLGELADQARKTWDDQSALTKGAIGGAVLATLFTRGGRRVLGSGLEIGGAALVGALAMKAYESWLAGAVPSAGGAGDPTGTAFLPADPAAADDLAARLLQAMVAAVKADGQVTDAERAAVNAQVAQLQMAGDAASALIAAEMDAALDPGRIASLARSPEEAAAIYTASALVVNRQGAAEKGYLAMLAARLGLDAGLVAHLDAQVAGSAAQSAG